LVWRCDVRLDDTRVPNGRVLADDADPGAFGATWRCPRRASYGGATTDITSPGCTAVDTASLSAESSSLLFTFTTADIPSA
jgi:hypothetical protein